MDRRTFCQTALAAGVTVAAASRRGFAQAPQADGAGDAPALFTPLTLRGVTLRNRIAMSPMCQYSSEDGFANEWHLAHHASRALGGAGLLIAEATGVVPEGRITPSCLGIWKDEHVPALRRVTDFVREHGAVPGIQLAHAGVKASRYGPFDRVRNGYVPIEQGGWMPVGPTAKRYRDDGPVPHELTAKEIRAVTASFADAAQRSIDAGFQVVELHFAHGYLGHSFLSPLMNERTDDYGGPFENRVRFLLETTRAVRSVLPEDAPLFVRLSCTDWVEGGWSIEDSVRASRLLKEEGVDLVDCSTGGATRNASIPVGPDYQVPFAERIRREAGIPTGAVGLITEPAQANAIIEDGRADLVLLGRQLLREPHWPARAWVELNGEGEWQASSERGQRANVTCTARSRGRVMAIRDQFELEQGKPVNRLVLGGRVRWGGFSSSPVMVGNQQEYVSVLRSRDLIPLSPQTLNGYGMPAPESITRLTKQFHEHIDAYKRGNYNETQLRREFLDPFFGALGWDIFNEQGYAGDYKDVVHEAALKIGGTTKAPDYSFRIGGQRKFFVEAKKPSVDVKGDPHPAYQLRRYAWTAQLPLSILTDFEEFAVYDCRIKPTPRDKASTARILYMTFEEYEKRWGEIEGVFSKSAILKGAFDKYASKKTRKRGTAEPDDEFLKLLEDWRSALAQNIARNNRLTVRQINHAVQLVIDRIVFLRICEDRGVEIAGTLKDLLNGPKIYERLLERFRLADAKYNSGLFHFEKETGREPPDTLTPSLVVGDKVLSDIIGNLYYPESPYELSVLPADILGHIYERFLGSVITLSSTGKSAKIEEKPEVRKAGGVYYTPTYIVDYIVEHTVGELLKDRTLELKGRGKARGPVMNKPLRVLDPACGSGSFLLGAYDHLLEWHLRYYTENDPESWAKLGTPPIARQAIPDERATHGDYKLTTHEKKRILTDHIFGVDIDAQAVEVTKLSLLLKVLEGENEETLQPLLFAKERALPDLSDNIRCGNSLIGSDFYSGQQGTMFDEEEQYRINAFDWDVAFREIMESGGFEAVIGNPPYVLLQILNQPDVFAHLSQKYSAARYKIDTYHIFIEHGLRLLGSKVFKGASVDTLVLICSGGASEAGDMTTIVESRVSDSLGETRQQPIGEWLGHDKNEFGTGSNSQQQSILEKIDGCSEPLGSFATAYFGIQTRDRTRYVAQEPVADHFLDFDVKDQVSMHDRMVKLVKSMLDMNARLHGEGGEKLTPQERRVLESRIAYTDREIDRLVYDLYGLTDEEIAAIEEATST
ncbi:eco57IR [Symbiodinium necroappetens]|uniref:Eco57IR protein n=1 Tax=Symbiodinium necroappetens TaxID=1628268 RepID=A0A812J8M5_9DINO|nr:eco57IR [Symbiodinium necroappetens]